MRVLLPCLGLFATASANAQWVLGPWEDAAAVPRGVLRAGVGTWWTRANERFERSNSSLESLGADFTPDSLGSTAVELIAAVSAPLKTLTGLAAPPLSLGQLRVRLEATSFVTPISVEYGVTRRFSLGAVIPYVKNRADVLVNPNPSGPTGTLGVNPAYLVSGARSRNTQVVSELQAAATNLQSELTRCLNSPDPTCAAINANRQTASDLVTSSLAAAAAIANVYGTNTAAGQAVVPVDRALLQNAVETRLTAFNTQFRSLLGAPTVGEWIASRPVGAPPLAYAEFQRVLTDSAFGIVAAPLADIEHSHLGDIEVGGKAVLFDAFGAPTASAPTRGMAARVAVAGVLRLGTAQRESPDNFADIGTGDGQTDVEVRGYLDLLAGRRLWTSVIARYGVQMSDRVTVRVPIAPGDPFPALYRTVQVDRDLGDYVELEIAPRFVPNEAFAFSGNYLYRSKQADRYSNPTPLLNNVDLVGRLPVDPAVLARFSLQRQQRVGWAVTYSTVRGYANRRAPWPLDVSLVHTQVLSGRGGVPKEFATAVAIRLYRPLVGPDPMRGVVR